MGRECDEMGMLVAVSGMRGRGETHNMGGVQAVVLRGRCRISVPPSITLHLLSSLEIPELQCFVSSEAPLRVFEKMIRNGTR